VRTGAGKSQTSRRIARLVKDAGLRVAVVRHPMPYGDLSAQRLQRFTTVDDLKRQRCTIEEMEEYEPHLPALHVVVADPLRLGNELAYHPGEANLRMADVVVINKIDTADLASTETLRDHVRSANPRALIVEAASPVRADGAERITGRRVLVVEDGPTLTHGEMRFGAGTVLARKFGAAEIVDPRPFAVGSIAATYAAYPAIGRLLPAMGYGDAQIRELEATIAQVPCDVVVVGTPIDLSRLITIDRPVVRARYELQEVGAPDLADALAPFLSGIAPTT
jgi:predicted GTPase